MNTNTIYILYFATITAIKITNANLLITNIATSLIIMYFCEPSQEEQQHATGIVRTAVGVITTVTKMCLYIYIYVCMYIYTYMCIYIHIQNS